MGCIKLVRFFEEVVIFNWLFVNGIDFEYEVVYVEGVEKLCFGVIWILDFIYGV